MATAKEKEGAPPRSFAVWGFREEDVRAKNAFGRNKKYICGGDGIGFYGVFTLFALTSEI